MTLNSLKAGIAYAICLTLVAAVPVSIVAVSSCAMRDIEAMGENDRIEAHAAGVRAAQSGVEANANPFMRSTFLAKAWLDGWMEGRRASEQGKP